MNKKSPPLEALITLLLARVAPGEHIAIIWGENAWGDFVVAVEGALPPVSWVEPQQLEFDFTEPESAKKPRSK